MILFLLLISLLFSSLQITHGQSTLQGPITAMAVKGDQLLVGQGSTLLEASITPDALQITNQIDLKHRTIRDITVSGALTLVLSDDGLTTLDATNKVIDFASGGGQRVITKNGRVYIAALTDGVRILTMDSGGKLKAGGTLTTLGPAADLAAESNGWLWVAEGASGVRLYDTTNNSLLVWLDQLKPATTLRISGARIIIGYGNHVSILNTINIKSPALLSTVDLDQGVRVSDMLVDGNRVLLAQLGTNTADASIVDITDPKAIKISARAGTSGAGERLAISTNDILIGSSVLGLERLRSTTGSPGVVATWEAPANAGPCVLAPPSQPDPPNLSEIKAGEVTLTWKSACDPTSYEIKINGNTIATIPDAKYTFTPDHAVTRWQITAIDSAGNRSEGPEWSFESAVEGWLATPAAAPRLTLLYVTPPTLTLVLHSPQEVLIATCAALGVGLFVIILAGYTLGRLADRRQAAHKEKDDPQKYPF